MKLHKINDLSNKYVIKLLKENFDQIEDEKIIENYHPNFSNSPANIFYILNSSNGRYSKGCYYVLEDKGTYICSAGWNEYTDNIALALTRAYVSPKFRAQYYMGRFILPMIVENTQNYDHLYITVNSYNSAIFKYFQRVSEGKKPTMFNDWPDIYKKFKPVGIKDIYNVLQFVVEYQR